MQTYKYQFPAHGNIGTDTKGFIGTLEQYLNDSPDCLGAYAMFPSDSAILDHVSIDTDRNGNVQAVNVHTYTQLWEGNESYLKDCIETNLAEVAADYFDSAEKTVTVDGDVQFLGREGDVPKTLYHIAERADLDTVLQSGLTPDTGDNSYKSDKDYVYLCDQKDLMTWLAVLKHVDDPVLVEVNAEGLDIEMGRVFKERSFAPDGYTEYRTTESIPASSVKEADLANGFNELSNGLRARIHEMNGQFDRSSKLETQEIMTGVERLVNLGVIEPTDIEISMEEEDFAKAVEGITSSDEINL